MKAKMDGYKNPVQNSVIPIRRMTCPACSKSIERLPSAQARDPVCGMYVNQKTAKYTSEYEGKKYFFCKEICKVRFEANPDYYLQAN